PLLSEVLRKRGRLRCVRRHLARFILTKLNRLFAFEIWILDFQPVLSNDWTFDIRTLGVFRNDTLEPKCQGTSEHCQAFPLHVVNIENPRVAAHKLFKEPLPFQEWTATKI